MRLFFESTGNEMGREDWVFFWHLQKDSKELCSKAWTGGAKTGVDKAISVISQQQVTSSDRKMDFSSTLDSKLWLPWLLALRVFVSAASLRRKSLRHKPLRWARRSMKKPKRSNSNRSLRSENLLKAKRGPYWKKRIISSPIPQLTSLQEVIPSRDWKMIDEKVFLHTAWWVPSKDLFRQVARGGERRRWIAGDSSNQLLTSWPNLTEQMNG